MAFTPSIGYQLEQMRAAGDADGASYLASTVLTDVLSHYMEDGWSDEDLRDTFEDALANCRDEYDAGREDEDDAESASTGLDDGRKP